MKENKGFYQPLPANLYPTGEVCVTVRIPNDVDWIKTFWGHFIQLTRWATFERDTAHNARIVAAKWLQIWNTARSEFNAGVACYVPPIYQEPECGLIQVSNNSGVDWSLLADFRECFVRRSPENAAQNTVEVQSNFTPLTLYNPYSSNTALLSLLSPTRGVHIDGNAVYNVFGGGCRFTVGSNIDFLEAAFPVSAPARVNLAASNYYGRIHLGNNIDVSAILGSQDVIPLGMWHIYGQNSDEELLILQAASGQDADLQRNISSTDSLYSGIDNVGRYFMALTSGVPSDVNARPGTLLVDPETEKVYAKGEEIGVDDWFEVGSGGSECACIETASADTLEPDEPATAEIIGTELVIGVPRGETGETGETGIAGANGHSYIFPSYKERPTLNTPVSEYMTVPADSVVMLPWRLSEGDVLTFDELEGNWTDTSFTETFPLTSASSSPTRNYDVFGNIYGSTAHDNESTDPDPDLPHMCLLYMYKSEAEEAQWNNVTDALVLNISQIDPDNRFMWFFANTANREDAYGGCNFKVTLNPVLSPIVSYFERRFSNADDGAMCLTEPYQTSRPDSSFDLYQSAACDGFLYICELKFFTDDTYTEIRPVALRWNDMPGLNLSYAEYVDINGEAQLGILPQDVMIGGIVYIQSLAPWQWQDLEVYG